MGETRFRTYITAQGIIMRISDAVELFLQSIIAEGKSENTKRWYDRRLCRLGLALDNRELDSISPDDLRKFLAGLHTQSTLFENHPFRKPRKGALSPFTVQSYVRAVKRFFSWLVENNYLAPSQNPAAKLKRYAVRRGAPKELSDADLSALVNGAHHSKYPERDYALILFLADTGCRVGGLVGVRLEDIDFQNERVLVTEKGRKTRYAFLSQPTIRAIEEWLKVRKSSTEYVFVNRNGRQFTVSGINQAVESVAKAAGVSGRHNPHSFRHRFAKKFLMAGGDLASLSRLMGHGDVGVTASYYTVFLTDELKRKHDQHSALAGIV